MGCKSVAALVAVVLLALSAGLLASCGPQDKGITSLDQLNQPGVKIGVATDSTESELVKEHFPNAEVVYAKDLMSSFESIAQGKIDAFVGNKLNMELALHNGLKRVRLLDGSIGQGNVAAAAISPRTQIPDLKGKINEFLKQIRENGTLDDMRTRWMEKRDMTMPDIPEAKDPQYHLAVGTTGVSEPFTCYANGELVGYDVEIAKRFASWLGASIEFKIYDYEGIVPSALGGDVDCIFANLYVTSERQQTIEFSDPTFVVEVGAMVRDTNAGVGAAGFIDSLAESFDKTFIREDRWKLFAEGIGTTLLITVLSILFGTALGFGAFMACRKGNRAANAIARFCIWLIEGMPVVVLLMILYYIVFSETALSGVAVSVIAFTLIFAASVFNMLKAGVAAVGAGQMEAAYSLGYTDRKAFFNIVLPQALRHVMPSYKGSIKSLIKATAVVGYVAVQDLTKMGDIVRSRTYEAFFPLIAIAVIYFVLAAILIWIVNKIELRAIPGRKPDESNGEGVQAQ
ncbi:MAG: transporter substrate-binding domain-containing protein [Eggerthellaceae bacterium]|nr:transporter substrate-binding domain-containing protein [Eggerthellaceae bacterium]